MRRFEIAIVLLLTAAGTRLGAAATSSSISEPGIWRSQPRAAGLSTLPVIAISFSPRGTLWIVHGSGAPIQSYDGWTARAVPPALHPGFPVKESRSGQIWSLHPEGLQEFRRGEWVVHPVSAVQAERDSHPLKVLRPLPILPAERDRVLIALPNALLKHDTTQGRSTVLRSAQAAGMGQFVDLLETAEGHVWVVGEDGAARLSGPVRRISDVTPWHPALIPKEAGVRCVGRAFEGEEERLVVLADAGEGEAPAMVICDGQRWSQPLAAPRGTRHVWIGPAGTLWAHTRTAVFRAIEGAWREVRVPVAPETQFFGVAVDAIGGFCLATSSSLLRYAPALWQSPPGPEPDPADWSCFVELPDGSLVFGADDRLLLRKESRWSVIRLGVDEDRGLTGRLHQLRSRALFVNQSAQLMSIDSAASTPSQVTETAHLSCSKILGTLGDGRLAIQVRSYPLDAAWRIEALDDTRLETLFTPGPDWALGADLHFVHASHAGSLWLGSEKGLATWNERQRKFLPSEDFPPIPARSMVDVGNGRLWCAGDGQLFEGDGRSWTIVPSSIRTIERLAATPDGAIWGLSGKRLLRQIAGAWLPHDRALGIPDATVRDVGLDRQGSLWAVTTMGLRQAHPEVDQDAPRSQVTIPDGRREHPVTSPITFHISGRDRWNFTPSDRLLFSMRLNDGAWSPYSISTAFTLTNLPAGQQRLAVRAMDPAFNEEADPTIYEFTTFIPWYAEPRIVVVTLIGIVVAAALAGLAINRHFQLRRSYAEVERIVEERTRDLERANLELVHSQKMRALGTLAAGIAHDFSSILSIIQGSAQIIESNPADTAKIQTRVDRIKKMVDQGSGIVKTMLGLSRPSKQEWRSIDPGPWLDETARLVTDQLPPNVAIHVEPAPDLGPIQVVPELLRQLLLNLIFNASEAMAGRGEILLRVRCVDSPGATVLPPQPGGPQLVVEIIDTGQGIDAEVLPRIFEPFFTTKAFSTRRGTGLGLTMVYEIARALGLGLAVDSARGKGSVFSVYLPRIRRPTEPVDRPAIPS